MNASFHLFTDNFLFCNPWIAYIYTYWKNKTKQILNRSNYAYLELGSTQETWEHTSKHTPNRSNYRYLKLGLTQDTWELTSKQHGTSDLTSQALPSHNPWYKEYLESPKGRIRKTQIQFEHEENYFFIINEQTPHSSIIVANAYMH